MKRFDFIALLMAFALVASPAAAADKKPMTMVGSQPGQLQPGDKMVVNPSTTSAASIKIPQGVAPSAPTDGDCWSTATGLMCQHGGRKIDYANFTSPETGAVARPISDKLNDEIGLADFQPDTTGTTDVSAKVQAWVNACIAKKATCRANAGSYLLTSTVNITGPIHIVGDSRYKTTFLLGTPNLVGFLVTTPEPIHVEHTGYAQTSATPTGGNAFTFDPGVGFENDNSTLNDNYFNGNYMAIAFVRAAYWTVSNSLFYSGTGTQVYINNLNNADAGDSVFTHNKCIYGVSNSDSRKQCIYWAGSGGLRVTDNKFLSGFRAIELEVPNAITGTITIANNSMENQYQESIFFGQAVANQGQFTKVTITGNEHLLFGSAGAFRLNPTSTTNRWMVGLTYTGNNIELNGDFSSGASPRGVQLSQVQGGSITGNTIRCSGTTSGSYGYLIDSSVDNVAHSGNKVMGCTTAASDASTNSTAEF